MFPTYPTNVNPRLPYSNEIAGSSQAYTNGVVDTEAVIQPSEPPLDYFDFQDPLYGYMDVPIAPSYDTYNLDFGQNT